MILGLVIRKVTLTTLINKILVAVFILIASPVFAATYYVAIDGSDSTGDGSENNEWRHIYHGIDQLSCGDTLIVRDGTYTAAEDADDMVEISNNFDCTSETEITIKSETQLGAVIDGSSAGREAHRGFFFDDPGGGNVVRYVRLEDFEIKNVSIGVRVGPDSEDAIHHIYLYRLKIHDADSQGINSTNYSEYVTVDSCIIYNIYGWEDDPDLDYWIHNHGWYAKGKDNILKNSIIYQPEGGMALRIDGYSGSAPANYSMLVVNNTFYGVQTPYPNPDCCPSSPYDVRSQAGLINFFKATAATYYPTYTIIDNNVFIDPPGENRVGEKRAIVFGNMGNSTCDSHVQATNRITIRNNVTDAPDLVNEEDSTCEAGDFAAYSNNTTGATLTDDLTDYTNYDFTLKSGGDDLIDAGLSTNAPAVDYAGNLRSNPDIGAYEYIPDESAPNEGVVIN